MSAGNMSLLSTNDYGGAVKTQFSEKTCSLRPKGAIFDWLLGLFVSSSSHLITDPFHSSITHASDHQNHGIFQQLSTNFLRSYHLQPPQKKVYADGTCWNKTSEVLLVEILHGIFGKMDGHQWWRSSKLEWHHMTPHVKVQGGNRNSSPWQRTLSHCAAVIQSIEKYREI